MVLDDKTAIFGDAEASGLYGKLVLDELTLSAKPTSYKRTLRGLEKFHEWYVKKLREMLKSTKSKRDLQKIKDELDLLEEFCKREKRYLIGDMEMNKLERRLKRTGIFEEMDKIRKILVITSISF